MGVTVEFVDGFDGLAGVLDNVTEDFAKADYTESLDAFLDVLDKEHQERFDRRESPGGESWEPWHFRRAEAPDNHETLEVSRRMRDSLKQGGSGHIEELTSTSLVFGTGVEYAGIHQFGSTHILGIDLVGRGGVGFKPAGSQITIPQREFVGMNESTVNTFTETIADDVVVQLTK